MQLTPRDAHDEELLKNVHPAEWKNPTPCGPYHLVAIGGGPAGQAAAVGAADFGAKVALVEGRLLGGNSLNFGCVPSKALLRSARGAHAMNTAAELGFRGPAFGQWDFAAVMQRVRRLRAATGQRASAERFAALEIDVFLGAARFTGKRTLEIDGQAIEFRRAVIATGASPVEPNLAGLAELGYRTNETIFSLSELPRTLIVIGAGPVGCELAQAFRRLGSDVHLVSHHDGLLRKEDREVGQFIAARLAAEGIHLHLGWQTVRAQRLGPSKALVIQRENQKQELIGDEILVAVGRRPNVDTLDLPAAGIEATPRGVVVNDYLQTSNRRVYAAGDVCAEAKFTHAAEAMARIAVQNALFLRRKKFSRLNIPRCTYTDPEIAHVGLTAGEALGRGLAIDSYRAELLNVDRAVLDGETAGFAVVHTRRGGGRVVGGTIIAAHAGEMIGELTLLINRKLSLHALAETIHCYPTQVAVLQQIADQYQRTRRTPLKARLLKRWLAWRP